MDLIGFLLKSNPDDQTLRMGMRNLIRYQGEEFLLQLGNAGPKRTDTREWRPREELEEPD